MARPTLSSPVGQYGVITANYWVFTLTDGALRMLVVLYFHQLGYTPLDIALLFLFYEFFGVVTNLVGGWLGARIGLNKTMNLGLGLQVVALAMLLLVEWLTVPWVMAAQALSGIAKDLNKMSAKSAIKTLVPEGEKSALFRWVALLTGSKNTLKGVGFFLGGLLLSVMGFQYAILSMAIALVFVWLLSLVLLQSDLGRAKAKGKFSELLSKSRAINLLSAARLFLFGARDVWFVVALPVYLSTALDWNYTEVGAFLASWVIGYGLVQSLAPTLIGKGAHAAPGVHAARWAALLAVIPAVIALGMPLNLYPAVILVAGLLLFGVIFAINSSLHSFLIVDYARADGVSMDVGFYYMANAMGRLVGTVLSGWLFQAYGLGACLWVSAGFLGAAALISMALPTGDSRQQSASL